ncbi:MAG: ornithine cyclodeaminase family protein [Actinobacteria bacterium]|nr:ornithine cyclodeaminase family protein [Actinomycetota bacterium]
MDTLLLSKSDIQKVMTMKDVVEIVDKTFIGFGEGKVINPTKVNIDFGSTIKWPHYNSNMNAMPAYVGWLDSAGIKWVGGFSDNAKVGLPYICGMILLINPKNGQFKAVMEGAEITNMRTGAQAAVALKCLHDNKSIKIGLYGAGVQGYHQTTAMAQLFDIEELKVYDIKREAAERFADDMKDTVTGNILIADSPEEAADGDAVICVTQAKDKFVKNSWVKPGSTLFAMGSYQECDDDFILTADKIIIDHIGQCLHRGALKELSEKGKISEKDIYATVGEIAAGKKKGRSSDKERLLCIPIGTGAMDIAVATVAYQRALEKGLGEKFRFV